MSNEYKKELSIELIEQLNKATGQMQSGVAFVDQPAWEQAGIHPLIATELKHLLVGVNAARTETAALADLLIKAGICTGDDYIRACIRSMDQEILRYQNILNERFPGTKIRLGEAGKNP